MNPFASGNNNDELLQTWNKNYKEVDTITTEGFNFLSKELQLQRETNYNNSSEQLYNDTITLIPPSTDNTMDNYLSSPSPYSQQSQKNIYSQNMYSHDQTNNTYVQSNNELLPLTENEVFVPRTNFFQENEKIKEIVDENIRKDEIIQDFNFKIEKLVDKIMSLKQELEENKGNEKVNQQLSKQLLFYEDAVSEIPQLKENQEKLINGLRQSSNEYKKQITFMYESIKKKNEIINKLIEETELQKNKIKEMETLLYKCEEENHKKKKNQKYKSSSPRDSTISKMDIVDIDDSLSKQTIKGRINTITEQEPPQIQKVFQHTPQTHINTISVQKPPQIQKVFQYPLQTHKNLITVQKPPQIQKSPDQQSNKKPSLINSYSFPTIPIN